ncbi:IS3 family transposase [Streptococcus pneumoniae]|uniref:IS3 family transposase n=4 Tax=Streptococcus pneumoniae TaxID=1313 RepID=UPI00102479DB|nr:IS3 family transposase [Streptococcus pneumoniae]VFH75712.1 IS3-Spn1, transposase [Streptococcus pneumoniae]
MKLTYDDKVQIYELRKQGYILEKLSNKFGINNSNLRYMIKLIDRYGIEFVKKGKNRYYSPGHEGWTKDRVSLEYGLPSRTILLNWLAQYRKNGYTIVEKTRGRVPESGECHPKKVKRTPIEGGKRERRKTEIVQELMTEFSLDLLLKAIKLARWTYYYHLKQLDKTDKDQELKAEIQSIFIEHKGNYGYRRIYLELRNRGYLVNHKRVQHLMKVLNLQAKMRQKRKYSSHKGDVGKKAENLIQGQFEGSKTMEQCYTDVTEFAIPASTQKLYLSPVLDGFNSEIIAYNLSTSPNLEQVQTMLEQAFTEKHYENTILHSDQGWQYRHDSYHRFLESKGVQASMSRKGNSQDNGMMESFFGILKSEMFYGYEKSFQSLKQLEQAIVDYIDYYNNKRIKVKLKGLSPVQYRTKSFG